MKELEQSKDYRFLSAVLSGSMEWLQKTDVENSAHCLSQSSAFAKRNGSGFFLPILIASSKWQVA